MVEAFRFGIGEVVRFVLSSDDYSIKRMRKGARGFFLGIVLQENRRLVKVKPLSKNFIKRVKDAGKYHQLTLIKNAGYYRQIIMVENIPFYFTGNDVTERDLDTVADVNYVSRDSVRLVEYLALRKNQVEPLCGKWVRDAGTWSRYNRFRNIWRTGGPLK